ncbi:putrescine-ornithine antiporter, partial [Staphylococcus caprae]
MASIKSMQKETSTNISNKTMKWTNIIAIIAGIYTLYAIYSSGGIAVYYGAIVTFAGWTLYGLISYRFDTGKSK